MPSTTLRFSAAHFSVRIIRRMLATWVVAAGIGAPLCAATPAPQFDAIPSQGYGVILSDPTIRPMQSPGSPASFFAMRPIDLAGTGRPDLFTCYGIVPPAPAQKMPCRVFRPQPDGSITDITRQLFGNGPLPGSVAPRVIVEGDFNEDGRADIFVACQGWDADPFPGEVNVLLLSNPDGTYTDASANLPQQPDFTHDAAVGDINGDGHLDLYVGNISGQQSIGPYFLLGNGDGTFLKATAGLPAAIVNTLEKFTACGLVDIDGDGFPDLVLGTHGDGGFLDSIVLFNNGTGNFTVRSRLVLPDGPLGRGNTVVQGIGVIDVNRDGRPDLILASSQYSTFSGFGLQILINKGNSVLADESTARLSAAAARSTGSPYQTPRFADLNGDGLMDFYFSNGPAENTSRYFLANADGTFTAVAPAALPQGLGVGVSAVNFGSDSRVDLLQISHTSNGDVFYQSFLNHTIVPPLQNSVAAIGASPLKAPLTADFSPGTTYTMEGWIYLPNVSASGSHLMGKTFETTADPYQSFALQLWSGNNLVFVQSNGTPGSMVFLNCPTAIPERTWTHVAAVVDGGTMQIYLNGVLSASATSPGAPPNQPTVPFALGLAFYPNGDPNNGTFPGYARQVRFWNVARTATQIAAALAESLPTNAAGLVAAWPLDESGGTTARDISGNGRALTVAGGSLSATRATVLAAGPFFTANATAVTDGSLQYVNPKGAMIDFDSDGDLDLIEVQGGPSTFPETRTRVRAFRFQNGAYVDATDAVLGTVELIAPSRSIVADFNGDGRSDLLVAGIGTDAIPWPGEQAKLLLQDATGHLLDMTATNLPQHGADYTHDCTVGDIDGDGDLDIYLGNLNVGAGYPRVYLNDGQGVFTEPTDRLPADIANRSITYTGCLLTDVNADGRADLVLGGWAGSVNKNEILLNDGSGTFIRPANPLLPAKMFGADGTVVLIVSTDLNGDGKTDLLLSTTDHYLYAGLQILLKQNDGTFTDATTASGITWNLNDTEIDRIDPVDLNADGKPDLVVHFASLGGSYTRLFLNRGDASFIEASDTFTRESVGTSFHSGDVDGDGFVDLVTVNSTGVTFYRGLKLIELTLFYDAPGITTQPLAQTVTAGSSVTFSATASGYPAPTYQWQQDGLNIGGATASSFTIVSVSLGDAGVYTVVVSNPTGSVTSSTAALTVNTRFETWRLSSFSAEELADLAKSGPNAIYGQDGLPNLVKYALGLDPMVNATSGTPEITVTATDWVFTYTRPEDRTDLTYTVQVSTDLVNWSSAGVIHERTVTGFTETWRATYPLSSAANVYFRLKVVQL